MCFRRIHAAGRSLGSALLVIAFLVCLLPAAAGAAQRPLPEADYSVQPVCGEPLPGAASCLAFALVPETKAARAHSHPLGMTLAEGTAAGEAADGAYGLRPEDLHDAYELPLAAPTS